MTSRLHARIVHLNLILIAVIVLILAGSPLGAAAAVCAGLSITLLASLILKTRVVRPLQGLFSAASKIAAGDLSQRAPIGGDSEIAAAASALNSITRTLEASTRELTEGKQKVESLVGAMREGVMLLDARGRVTLANRAVLMMIGSGRDIAGRTPLDIFRVPALDASVREALAGRNSESIELVPGTGRILEAHVSGVPNLSGVVDSVLIVFLDITEARSAERVRRDFVANVSHEFKTPLTAIRGFTETLMTGGVEDVKTQEDFLRTIDRNARHLETLVSHLLMLARLEAEPPAAIDSVNLKSVVDELVASKRGIISERQIRICVDCPPIELQADRARLVAAVSNLIDNAVYYNRQAGEIHISGARENGNFVLSVADTGEGIPPAELGRIFQRFYRVDKARSRQSGGTGLGLAIVKHAIESQGGTVSVTSKLGSGSKFSIHLPILHQN